MLNCTLTLRVNQLPCIRLARGKFELTNQDSAAGKNFTVLTSMYLDRKGIEISHNFSHWELYLMFTKGDLQFSKPYHIAKSEKYETSCVSKLLIWRQNTRMDSSRP